MTHSDRTTYDVLIVGAGPTGLTTAGVLAGAGVRALVVDRHAGVSPFPKATGVSLRTAELLRSWGLEDRLRAGAVPVRLAFSTSATLADPDYAEHSFGFPVDEELGSLTPTTALCCPQDHVEPVLLEHLRSHGGEVRFRTELTSLAMRDDGATATLHDLRSGATYAVQARFVVGADGPASTVRRLLGIDTEEVGRLGEWLAVTFRADLGGVVGDRRYLLHAVDTEEAAGLFLPSSNDHRWFYAWEWHPEQGEVLADWPPERCTARLRAATGAPGLEPEILRLNPFTMAGNVATAFRAGNGFLVGDAAHRMTPRGGMGMNTAIAAAHNLGWKLAWVLRGWAGEALLDSYEAERRPVGVRNTLRSLSLEEWQPGEGFAGDVGAVYRSDVILPGEDAGPAAGEPALAEIPSLAVPGARAPHTWIELAGRRMSSLDLFDGRLTLLTGRHGLRWRRVADELASGGLPLVTHSLGGDLRDLDGELARRYGIGTDGAVLIRPDGHVGWRRATAALDPAALLREAVGRVLGDIPGEAQDLPAAG
jgi:2-polyprenyl-6-methoxyphenol hydroxylase-like FAD-dependent oxidoreductase